MKITANTICLIIAFAVAVLALFLPWPVGFKVIYQFTRETGDVEYGERKPIGRLIAGLDGGFYGATLGSYDGIARIYRVTPKGKITILHSIPDDVTKTNAAFLDRDCSGMMIQGANGVIYCPSEYGGKGVGYIFSITTNGVFSIVHMFDPASRELGAHPSGIVQGKNGVIYGSTLAGGTANKGTIFKMKPNGEIAVLHSFTGGKDGANPSILLAGGDGNLYGHMGAGAEEGNPRAMVFRCTMLGDVTTLASIDWLEYLFNGLTEGGDGKLYGTMTTFNSWQAGSGPIIGRIYSVSTNGTLTFLHDFFANDGYKPAQLCPMTKGADGNLYGICYFRNAKNGVYRMTTNGAFSLVCSNMDSVSGPLTLGRDGNFYGCSFSGGIDHYGYIFRLSIK